MDRQNPTSLFQTVQALKDLVKSTAPEIDGHPLGQMLADMLEPRQLAHEMAVRPDYGDMIRLAKDTLC